MSMNFELLQRVAKRDVFNLTGVPAPLPEKAPAAISFKRAPQDTEISKLAQRLFSQPGKGGGPESSVFHGVYA